MAHWIDRSDLSGKALTGQSEMSEYDESVAEHPEIGLITGLLVERAKFALRVAKLEAENAKLRKERKLADQKSYRQKEQIRKLLRTAKAGAPDQP